MTNVRSSALTRPRPATCRARWSADYLVANYDDVDLNGDGTISYVMFMGQNANPEADIPHPVRRRGLPTLRWRPPASLGELTFYDANNADRVSWWTVDGTWSAQASNEYMTTDSVRVQHEANNNMVEVGHLQQRRHGRGRHHSAARPPATTPARTKGLPPFPVFGVDATDAAKELIKPPASMVGSIKQDAEGMARRPLRCLPRTPPADSGPDGRHRRATMWMMPCGQDAHPVRRLHRLIDPIKQTAAKIAASTARLSSCLNLRFYA